MNDGQNDDKKNEDEENSENEPVVEPQGAAIDAPSPTGPLTETEAVTGRGPSSTIEFQPPPPRLLAGLTSLRHRDFRIYWLSQLVSLTGTWMQIVAQSWLVLTLSDSPFILGVVSALQFLPTLTLSMAGGVIADRLPRRQLLLATQSSAMILAFTLAVLTQLSLVNIGIVMILALLVGTVNAVDMPTRQAFVVELVSGEDLHNAIALNSAAFNSARLVGPAVAGLAIGYLGLAGAFYANGFSFLAVIGGLLFITAGRQAIPRQGQAGSFWQDMREGLRYVAGNTRVRMVILLVGIVSGFALNLNVLIPILAKDPLNVGAQGLGFLTSAAGVGSLVAAVWLAFMGRRVQSRLLMFAAFGLGLAEVLIGFLPNFAADMVLLAVVGFTMIVFTTLANTVVQIATPDALRGRVMSVYTTVFVGITPLGSLFAGSLAEVSGVGAPFAVGGLASMVSAVLVYWFMTTRQEAP